MSENVPGDIKHWLTRASISELERIKAEELARPHLVRAMMLVQAIDEELMLRRSASADVYLEFDDPGSTAI